MGKLRRGMWLLAAALALLVTGAAGGLAAASFLPHDTAAALAVLVLAVASGAAGWAARSVVRHGGRPGGEAGAKPDDPRAASAAAGGNAVDRAEEPAKSDAASGRPESGIDSGPGEPLPADAGAAGRTEESVLPDAEAGRAEETGPPDAEPSASDEDAGRAEESGPIRAEPGRAFDRESRRFGNGDALTAELRLALEMQRKWQPPVDLRLGACRVTARSRQAADVGGDLFDAAVLDDAVVAVLIGDVPGKGLQAAFMVPAILLLFRSEVKRGGGPAELLARMNRVLAGLNADSLAVGGVTLGIGLLDTRAGELRYAGAGHPAPYIVMPGLSPRQLESSSLPLGMNADETYRETVFRFAPGERFVLYTDGVIEDAGPDGEMFGFDRFEAELAAWKPDEPAAEWMERLLDGQEQRRPTRRDDRTLLVVEYNAGKAGRRAELRERCWQVASQPGCERSVAAELAAMLREEWADSGRTDDIVSCVAEAVMNAAEHGNGFDAGKQVSVQVHFGHAIMVCRVRDEGSGFDPQARRLAKAAGGRVDDDIEYGRGWGLRLIDELTDYWIATRDQNGFCVEMYFLSKHPKS